MSLDALNAARPLVLLGAGKMGSALLVGWLSRGIPADAIRVIDPHLLPDTRTLLDDVGIEAFETPPASLEAGAVVLAVKPQQIADVLPSVRPLVGGTTLALSIAAGTRLSTLADGLGTTQVVRVMPNTPAQIGKGVSVAVGASGVGAAGRELATALLEAAGTVEWIEDEALIDAVTAVSGSGPAYVFYLAECLAEAGVAAGLDAALARRLADATVSGAGALMEATGEEPATLRRNVTSPGGTTAAALDVLMGEDGLAPLMREAVAAAKKRAGELG